MCRKVFFTNLINCLLSCFFQSNRRIKLKFEHVPQKREKATFWNNTNKRKRKCCISFHFNWEIHFNPFSVTKLSTQKRYFFDSFVWFNALEWILFSKRNFKEIHLNSERTFLMWKMMCLLLEINQSLPK